MINKMMEREKNRADFIITIQRGDEKHILEISAATAEILEEWIRGKANHVALKGDVIVTQEELMMALGVLKAGTVEK